MKDTINDIKLTVDGYGQILKEIKAELQKFSNVNNESPLMVDLLSKISNNINEVKKSFDNVELEKFKNEILDCIKDNQSDNSIDETAIQTLLDRIDGLIKEPKTINNRYTIDFKSSRTFIVILFLSFGLMLSIIGNSIQWKKNRKLSDNDLKFRFIKMHDGIDSDNFNRLENIFYYSDSIYMVKGIKKLVLDHEHKVEQQIRMQNQIKQNEERNLKLKKEIENLK